MTYDLTQRVINLSEYCLRNKVGHDIHVRSLELFQDFCESYKRKHGSAKHLLGNEYHEALIKRYDYAEGKVKEYIVSQMKGGK
jgi:hypothetical protein